MRTNAYGSDFGLNPNRIDIKLNVKNGLKTVDEIIQAIHSHSIYIETSLNFNGYDNEFCEALNAIGIDDIRYSGDYTLYKTDSKYILSGDHDNDMFLTDKDMNSVQWDILMGCSHQGQCDEDCEYAMEYFEIKDIDSAREYVNSFGLDIEQDDETITSYYLWMVSGDIQEFQYEEENQA